MQPKQVTSASPARARPQVGPGTGGAEWGECGGMAGEGQADAKSSGEQGTWSECPEGDEVTRDQPRALRDGAGGHQLTPRGLAALPRARPRRPGSRAAPSRAPAPP